MKRWEKKRCPLNPSHPVISWGATDSGSPRFFCKVCQTTFTWRCSGINLHNRFSLFKSWLKGSSVEAIAESGRGCRRDTLLRTVHWYLDQPPRPDPQPNSNCHLIIDGTWFKRKENCAIIYWDADLNHVQHWRYSTGEKVFEIAQDLKNLKRAGVVCSSITSDGAPGIAGAARLVYPDIPHQRCVTHLQRDARRLVTQRPRTAAGKELSPLISRLSGIETHQEKDYWIKDFERWSHCWEGFLKEKTYGLKEDGHPTWWYTHKQLRRAKILIKNAIPNLFHYLDDETIPKTSNGLEGRFSSFKQHYGQHRGLSKQRREGYIAWYLRVVVNGESPTREQY